MERFQRGATYGRLSRLGTSPAGVKVSALSMSFEATLVVATGIEPYVRGT